MDKSPHPVFRIGRTVRPTTTYPVSRGERATGCDDARGGGSSCTGADLSCTLPSTDPRSRVPCAGERRPRTSGPTGDGAPELVERRDIESVTHETCDNQPSDSNGRKTVVFGSSESDHAAVAQLVERSFRKA